MKKSKYQNKGLTGKNGDPYALSDDKDTESISLKIILLDPPEISYLASADEKNIRGSFIIDMIGKVQHSSAKIFQGNQCSIKINEWLGTKIESTKNSQSLGEMKVYENAHFFEVRLELNYQFASDIVRLIYDYKTEQKSTLFIRLNIENERRYAEFPKGQQLILLCHIGFLINKMPFALLPISGFNRSCSFFMTNFQLPKNFF